MDRSQKIRRGARARHRCAAPVTAALLALAGFPHAALARPETIDAGVSYYSDELVETGSVRDIGAERNYEEVFKLYTYYEVLYDEDERVAACLEYERGEVIRKDIYRYAVDGSLKEHIREIPGKPTVSVPLPGAD